MKTITVKRVTELCDTVTTTLTVDESRCDPPRATVILREDITIEGPPELIEFNRNSGGGRDWYRPADTKAKRKLWS